MRTKNLKVFFSLFVVALFLSSCVTTKLPDNYTVTPEVLETHGGSVSVEVKGTIPEKSFHKRAVVEFTPVLKYNGGETPLKPLKLKGEKAEGEGTVIPTKTGGTISYNDAFEYKPEMNASELFVKAVISKKGKVLDTKEIKIADGVIYTSTRVGKGETVQYAEHGYVKEVLINEKANLYFAYNKSNYNKNLALNKENADQLEKLNDFLRKGWKIKDININAWASPEGELSLNQKLSEDRGKTTNSYLLAEFKKLIREKESVLKIEDPEEEVKINVAAKGEDYDGFMKALDKSNIKGKNTIKNVIQSQATKAEREKQIRNMSVIYASIEEMLSVLRRGEIVVTCYEPRRTDEEIAQLSTTYPDSLNEKELLYAATLTKDMNTKLKIYNSATKVFPQGWKGYNNAAAINLEQGNDGEAAKLLDKANSIQPNNGKVLNNLGVVAAWKKNWDAAKQYYEQAQAKGVDVTYNKGVIMILDGNYDGALAALNKKCDYNKALAQLLKGNTNEAIQTLDCAPKTAEVYYLLAIIGAKTGNTSMMTDNLSKAIKEVPAYKAQAKEDREFLKYFENSEFKAIVQ